MTKINVSAVSYLNTKPLLYGLQLQHLDASLFNITLETPAKCAESLLNGKSTIGLVPVAMIHNIPNATIITDYCIGSVGEVKTVMLYSNEPMEDIRTIFLDSHSRTSALLVRILCKYYWKTTPTFINNVATEELSISKQEGLLMIGDKTIGLDQKYAYTYDLASHWTKMTGLPFVFAAWITTQPVDRDIIQQMNAAFKQGIEQINELVATLVPSNFDVLTYFKENISYHFDSKKKEALNLYWDMCKEIGY